MKKILILILIVIISIFAYNQYKEYQRFHPKNLNYKASNSIDLNYHDQTVVYKYNEAIATLNGYTITQWSTNEIDVRNPENDDTETQYAVNTYAKKLAKVKFYEAKLEQSLKLKNEGLSNTDIKYIEEKGITKEAYTHSIETEKFRRLMLQELPKNNLVDGEKNAFVYQIQKLLVKKGFDIPVDGVYKNITSDALKAFEEKNQLFPDGKIDVMTLEALLN
jgi:hypothetical protein